MCLIVYYRRGCEKQIKNIGESLIGLAKHKVTLSVINQTVPERGNAVHLLHWRKSVQGRRSVHIRNRQQIMESISAKELLLIPGQERGLPDLSKENGQET
jgi:hypothetical protein